MTWIEKSLKILDTNGGSTSVVTKTRHSKRDKGRPEPRRYCVEKEEKSSLVNNIQEDRELRNTL